MTLEEKIEKKGKELVFLSIAIRVLTFAICITIVVLNDRIAMACMVCPILFFLMILFVQRQEL